MSTIKKEKEDCKELIALAINSNKSNSWKIERIMTIIGGKNINGKTIKGYMTFRDGKPLRVSTLCEEAYSIYLDSAPK